MNVVRSLGFRTDLMMLRLQGSTIEPADGYRVIRSPQNPTHYWGNFLLLDEAPPPGSLGRWLEIYRHELPDAKHIAFGVDGTQGETGDREEIAAAGLAVDTSVVLTAQSLRPPVHASTTAELRMLRADDWAQALELKEACNVETNPADFRVYAERMLAAKRVLQQHGHGSWFGAFIDGRMVAGLGIFSDGTGAGRYQTVETHPDFRRQGLAGSLVYLAGEYAQRVLGAETLVIVADPEYVAVRLYRALGFDGTEAQVQLERAPAN